MSAATDMSQLLMQQKLAAAYVGARAMRAESNLVQAMWRARDPQHRQAWRQLRERLCAAACASGLGCRLLLSDMHEK